MTAGKFEKVTRSDRRLYGSRMLLLCGFPAAAQPTFSAVMELSGLGEAPRIWVQGEQAGMQVGELMRLGDGTGWGKSSKLPKAVVVGGLKQKELMRLISVSKKTGIQSVLWAALTPISETWTLDFLLAELAAERIAMRQKRRL
jgi:hypothetical protein